MSRLTPAELTAIGAASGVTEVLIMQPSIAIKNALQEGRMIPWSPRALYRGLTVNAASIAPITAVQFGAHRIIEQALGHDASEAAKIGAAVGAGAVSSLISCPAELLMIQQQRTGQPLSAVARRIVGGAGLSGLYRGLAPTAIRESVFTGSYLGLCPVLKDFLDRQQALQSAPPGSTLALAGISAGLFAALATQPFDTAKTRMQAFADAKGNPEYATLRSTLRHLVRSQGLGSLWAGIAPRAFRIAGAVIILQSVRTSLIDLVEGLKRDKAGEELLLLPLPRD